MKRVLRPMLVGLLGTALLIGSGAGATFLMRSHADDHPKNKKTGDVPAPSETTACIGHVDNEPGVASLYPSQPGRVAEVLVHEDQQVKAGEVLLRLESRSAAFLVKQAEEDLKAAELQLTEARKLPKQHQLLIAQQKHAIEAARHRLSAACYALERKQNMVRADHLAPEEGEVAAALVKELEAALAVEGQKLQSIELHDADTQVARAQVDVDNKRTKLDMARYALDECSLRAPCDGKILRIFVSAGEVLGPQPKAPAVQFAPSGIRIVRAEIEQEFAARVHVGQTALIQDDASMGETWRGKVLRISDWYTHRRSILQEPLQFNDVRTVECIIQLDPGQMGLRIGQRVRVKIQ
jgi:multidrug resistance efflux pump